MTRGLRPVSSTKCSLSSASGRGLLAYTVLSVCSCCSERTVLTRGPLSPATLPLLRGLEEAGSGPKERLGLLLALLLDSEGEGEGEREGKRKGEEDEFFSQKLNQQLQTNNHHCECHPPQHQKDTQLPTN